MAIHCEKNMAYTKVAGIVTPSYKLDLPQHDRQYGLQENYSPSTVCSPGL
jgi:hypothetical protein